MYKIVIFDIDGTLLNTEIAVTKGLAKCLKLKYNIEKTPEEVMFTLGMPGPKIFGSFGIEDYKPAYSFWVKCIDDFIDDICVYDGILPTIKRLKEEGVMVAIATSKTRVEFDTTVKHFGMNDYFDYVVTIDDVVNPKPNAEPLLKVCQMAGVSPSEALFLGDTEFDIECAKNAGVDFGLALWGAHEEAKKKCSTHLASPLDIFNL